MKLRNTGRIAVAGLAIAAALSLSACGSDDPKPAKKSAVATTSATAAQNIPAPTIEMFNTQLKNALDPAYPTAQKAEMIQGFEKDPELVNRLAKQFTDAKGVINITSVNFNGGAAAQGVGNGNLAGQAINNFAVPFVYENTKWKVEKNFACAMLKNLNIENTVCPK